MSNALLADYWSLLHSAGITELNEPPSDDVSLLLSEMDAHPLQQNEPSFDTSPDAIERMKKLLAKPGMGHVLGQMEKEVSSAMNEFGWTLPLPIYTGLFPTGSNNAMATKTDNGVVILINAGLLMCIYQILKLYLLSVNLHVVDESDQSQTNVVSSLSPEELTVGLADICLAYLYRGSSTFAERLPTPGGAKVILLAQFVKWSEVFVLAHEYGHVLEGHLANPKSIKRIVPQTYVELTVVENDWKEELQADYRALLILVPPSLQKITDSIAAQLLMLRLTGVVGFFMIDWLITSISLLLGGKHPEEIIINDHPPALNRCEVLLEVLQKMGAGKLLGQADVLRQWFEDQRTALLNYLASKLP